MWRGTAAIAEITASSRMPCSRRRSIMRVRVRAEVLPMPPNFSTPALIAPPVLRARRPDAKTIDRSPASCFDPFDDARHFGVVGQIDLKRRHRNETQSDRMKIGSFAGIGGGACRADPVAGLSARRLGLHHRFGLVSLAQTRDAH